MTESSPDRTDHIFGLCPPILFAHRGGAREVPESTQKAFDYAIKVPTDVLELDIQMTADQKIVVWHGPDLDNVFIRGLSSNILERRLAGKRNIGQLSWDELAGNSFVSNPGSCAPLEETPQVAERGLMLLSAFLDRYGARPLNIEIKPTFKGKGAADLARNIQQFLDVLHKAKFQHRRILVVSLYHKILREFQIQQNTRPGSHFPTGLSWWEAIRVRWLHTSTLQGRALEPTRVVSTKTIKIMREAGGATFPFLTKFLLIGALDRKSPVNGPAIRCLLDRGVDGIMTDRPGEVRRIIDEWRSAR